MEGRRWRHGLATLVLVFASTANAGFVTTYSINELAQAPLLAVCTVVDVVQREPVAAGTVKWAGSHRWYEATLRVERVHSKLAHAPVGGDQILVRYISNGSGGWGMNGSPVWPTFVKGQRAVFPLSPSKERSDRWALFAEEGMNVIVPATGKEWRRGNWSGTPEDFLVRELIHALANGSPTEQFAASNFMRELFGAPSEANRLLDAAIGDDEERWLAVAASLVSSLGIPRPRVADIVSGAVEVDSSRGTKHSTVLSVLAHALQKSAKREFPGRLIAKLVDDAHIHAWGSANTLIEFKDSPALVDRLGEALRRNREGAVTIAWFLVRKGQHAFLPQALGAALRLVRNPGPVSMPELQAASGLVRDYGDDKQFGVLADTLRRLKSASEDEYRKLFGSAAYSENQREMELAAVLIDDTREGFPPVRYCDVAASRLQRLSGEDFGIGPDMTRSDWDRAVGRARDWLAKR